MANDSQRTSGTPAIYEDDRGKSNLINHPVIAIVKDNIDPTHAGRIRVYISTFGGINPDDSESWLWVNYMSPWFGLVSPSKDTKNPENSKYGEYVGNPVSYGMWMSAPDIGSRVLCVFVEGRPDQGYYIGSPPNPGTHHMVPAIGSSAVVVPNAKEASTYGDVKQLPVSEVNINDKAIRDSTSIYNEPKPVHSYQASILSQQGLIRDTARGTITSSSQRESPSRVFGISTPGGTIYQGGYTNNTIAQGIKTGDQSKFKTAGRTGGHTFVMDDGTLDGKDQLMRLRTSGGHMIMMNDSEQSIFVIHSNGRSWVELGKEGTVDIWSSNSFNVRTLGDINLHADRDVNIHAGRNLNMYGTSVNAQADEGMTLRSNADFSCFHGGKYSMTAASMSLQSSGIASFSSSAVTFIKGSLLMLNTGFGPGPKVPPPLTKINHQDTIYSQDVGWMSPSPKPLVSIASRAPTHQPYTGANKGVDVQINDQVAKSGTASGTPSAGVQAVNSSVPPVPQNPITPEAAATVPAASPITSQTDVVIPAATVGAMISQQASTVAALSPAEAFSRGTIPGAISGMNLKQAVDAGLQKIGTTDVVNRMMGQGLGYAEAAKLAMTGLNGITKPLDLLNNKFVQATGIATSLQTAATDLISKGVTNGLAFTQTAGMTMLSSNFPGVATALSGLQTSLQSGAQLLTSGLQTGLQTGLQSLTGGLSSQFLSGGNFAAALSDKVTGAFSGVTSQITDGLSNALGGALSGVSSQLTGALSGALGGVTSQITGALGGLGNLSLGSALGPLAGIVGGLFGGSAKSPTVAQLTAQLAAQSQIAFATTQKFIMNKALNPGVPNYLSGNPMSSATTEDTSVSNRLSSETARVDELKRELTSAQNTYNTDPSTDNFNKIAAAEKLISNASRSVSKTTTDFITSTSTTLGTVVAEISEATALPGGIDTFAANIGKDSKNIVSTLKQIGISNTKVDSAVSTFTNAAKILSDPSSIVSKLSGNLLDNAAKYLSTTKVGSLLGKLTTLTKSTGKSGGGGIIKPAVFATDTWDNAPIAAVTGQLLGDPIIPPPVFGNNTSPIDINAYFREQNMVLQKINTLTAQSTLISMKIEQTAAKEDTSYQSYQVINQLNSELAQVQINLQLAQNEYDQLISG